MAAAAGVDSRQYRFGFVIASPDQYPADFEGVAPRRDFRLALFLPRDDAGRFGRSLYPPRVVMLSEDGIEIRAHPVSSEPPISIGLPEIQFIECGHFLLQGWLRFLAVRSGARLAYNTCSSPSVDRFLAECRDSFIPPPAGEYAAERICFGEPLDLKFGNVCRNALAPGERILVQFFNPAKVALRRLGIVRRETWSAADLLALTSRSLLWITDRHRGRRERYGAVTSYAPVRSLKSWSCARTGEMSELVLGFVSGSAWRIPVPAPLEREAAGFLKEFDDRVRVGSCQTRNP